MKITLVLRLVDLSMLVARSVAKNRMLQLVESRLGLSCRSGDEVTRVRQFKGKAGFFPLLRASSPEDEGSTTKPFLLTYLAFPAWNLGLRPLGTGAVLRESPGVGVAAWTAGPGPLEVLSMRLLTKKPRLWLVVQLWEQVTVPGFRES